jgi:hypothetical protein
MTRQKNTSIAANFQTTGREKWRLQKERGSSETQSREIDLQNLPYLGL